MSVPRHHLLRHPLTSVRPMFCVCTIYDHSYAFLLLQSPISCFLCLFNTLCCDKNIYISTYHFCVFHGWTLRLTRDPGKPECSYCTKSAITVNLPPCHHVHSFSCTLYSGTVEYMQTVINLPFHLLPTFPVH